MNVRSRDESITFGWKELLINSENNHEFCSLSRNKTKTQSWNSKQHVVNTARIFPTACVQALSWMFARNDIRISTECPTRARMKWFVTWRWCSGMKIGKYLDVPATTRIFSFFLLLFLFLLFLSLSKKLLVYRNQYQKKIVSSLHFHGFTSVVWTKQRWKFDCRIVIN